MGIDAREESVVKIQFGKPWASMGIDAREKSVVKNTVRESHLFATPAKIQFGNPPRLGL